MPHNVSEAGDFTQMRVISNLIYFAGKLIEMWVIPSHYPEIYFESCQTSKKKYFAKIIDVWKQLTFFKKAIFQLTFTFSMLTIETLEKDVKYFQS